jgi:transposase
MVARLAGEIITLDTEIADTETMIEERFRRHRHAEIIVSMPAFGVILGAEFLAATGRDMGAFDSADRLAGICGLAPVPRDSGRISDNLKRPRRYHRRLLRTCSLAAQSAAQTDPASRAYYERKRAEGKHHRQAVLALARRRLNVLWAMLRDHLIPNLNRHSGLTNPLRIDSVVLLDRWRAQSGDCKYILSALFVYTC